MQFAPAARQPCESTEERCGEDAPMTSGLWIRSIRNNRRRPCEPLVVMPGGTLSSCGGVLSWSEVTISGGMQSGLPPPMGRQLVRPRRRERRRSQALQKVRPIGAVRQLLGVPPQTKSSCDTATAEDDRDRYERLTGRSRSHRRNFGRGFCHLLPDQGVRRYESSPIPAQEPLA